MELFPPIINLVAELAKLAWTLFTDGTRFIALLSRSRTALAAENLFLRKQLAFYQERKIRPRRFDNVTRFILVLLSHAFAWQHALVNITPKTFIGWHRAGFRLFWRWKSRPGRPRIPAELRALIRAMARDNPSWGEERIANELLLKLGIQVSPRTVRKYMPKHPHGQPRGDQCWSTSVRNHAAAILACDFCVVVTATFRPWTRHPGFTSRSSRYTKQISASHSEPLQGYSSPYPGWTAPRIWLAGEGCMNFCWAQGITRTCVPRPCGAAGIAGVLHDLRSLVEPPD